MRSTRSLLLVLALVATFLVAAAALAVAAPMMGTYVGYLMDVTCADNTKALDGTDTLHSPWDHSKGCLIACKASGFGVEMRVGDSYKFFKFDKAGSDLALSKIVNMTKRDKDFAIVVEGTLDMGVIKVKSIKEANVDVM